jgi:hypothetical protein
MKRALLMIGAIGCLTGLASAQTCPPAGARYVIKGFTGNTGVTAKGAPADPKGGCQWRTDDGRDLSWKMGSDVVPTGAAPSTAPPKGPLAVGSVYRCTLPGVGLFTGAYFGIVDGRTYQNFDRKRGSYSYDSASGVLRMTSGPSKA